jgi:hypothetical protein
VKGAGLYTANQLFDGAGRRQMRTGKRRIEGSFNVPHQVIDGFLISVITRAETDHIAALNQMAAAKRGFGHFQKA